MFLANGARLYLDVGSHPEYATPECDSILDLVTHDKAGERILEQLLGSRRAAPPRGGHPRASSTSSRTTPTRPATATAATRTTSPRRRDDFGHYAEVLIPFFVSPADLRRRRQGAADRARRHVLHRPARRAHLGGRVAAPPPGSRPIINTRDEPHADAERYRRLHVIVGDSNMSEYATFLKVGATSILLRMLEDPSQVLRDLTLENPIRAIREISHDITCRRKVRLANGRELSRPRHPDASTSTKALQVRRDQGPRRRSRSRRCRCGSTASPPSRTTR